MGACGNAPQVGFVGSGTVGLPRCRAVAVLRGMPRRLAVTLCPGVGDNTTAFVLRQCPSGHAGLQPGSASHAGAWRSQGKPWRDWQYRCETDI